MKVRLGWHDSGTYDKNIKEWPQRGGANGSLRFDVELKHGANAGNITFSRFRFLVACKCTFSN
jgi:catalase (peroxidase I)